jgi:hypothetical protein
LGFDDEASTDSPQVNVSYAAAAVGIFFRPQGYGVLTVATTANINEYFYWDASWAAANVRGWAGFLAQSYDANNSLVGTPVYQRIILFDEGSTGTHWLGGRRRIANNNP